VGQLLADWGHEVRHAPGVEQAGPLLQDVEGVLVVGTGHEVAADMARLSTAEVQPRPFLLALVSASAGQVPLDALLAAAVDDDRIEVAGPPVRLKDRAAEVMALAIHELATNAVKFGALAVHSGRVSVQWRVTERSGKGLLAVEWRESGVPALDHAPRRNGFGRGLIERGLAYELGARTSLQFVGGGLLATMELPLDGGKVVLDADVGEPT